MLPQCYTVCRVTGLCYCQSCQLRLQLSWVYVDPIQAILPLGNIHILLSIFAQVFKVLGVLQQPLADDA